MIESVITARRRFLKPDGLVWPSGVKLYLVPCSAQQLYTETIECWGEKFGLDFSVLRYRSGTVNSNTVNAKFHLIRSFFEIFARFLSFHV